ncbi:UTRA domain-containing protein [Nonomuraea soli]|uniref:UbiC transcription regulator-associated domain-containing protein n=1 Tax=Nonomuraea soli TaxID=1032476 RepID=A0A7W0CSC9_9ACTN|nr:UTRA domain-containing protein [Nonomuraea soli]MBA2896431.1 hypothetical protein [Nonomuraea soli]
MNSPQLDDIRQEPDLITRARLLFEYRDALMAQDDEVGELLRQTLIQARKIYKVDLIANRTGRTRGRISQITVGAPRPPSARTSPPADIRVERQLPTAINSNTGLSLVYLGLETARDRIAAALRLEEGGQVLARRQMQRANGVPVQLITSFLPADFDATRAAKPGFELAALHGYLVELGHEFGHADEEMIMRPTTPIEAHTLDTEPGEWVAHIIRTSYSTEGEPMHALETICPGSRTIFHIGQTAPADRF